MGESIWECFHVVRDPRVERTRDHELHDIMVIAVCAVICGAEHWTEMEDFGNSNLAWFKSFLDLPSGIPSHDTFGRVFAALDPDEFEKAFRVWVDAVAEAPVGKHYAVDGKTVRRSFDTASGKAAIHMVSAWVYENNVCFGQIKVDGKSNEITRRVSAGPTSDASASGRHPKAPRHAVPGRRDRHHRRDRVPAQDIAADHRKGGRLRDLPKR
jgi:hypothetical protein